jgi:hypothetical protein
MRELIMYNRSDIFSKNIGGPEKGRFTLLVHTSKDKVFLWTHMRCLSHTQPTPLPLDHRPNTTRRPYGFRHRDLNPHTIPRLFWYSRPLCPRPWKSMPMTWHINAAIECDVYLLLSILFEPEKECIFNKTTCSTSQKKNWMTLKDYIPPPT